MRAVKGSLDWYKHAWVLQLRLLVQKAVIGWQAHRHANAALDDKDGLLKVRKVQLLLKDKNCHILLRLKILANKKDNFLIGLVMGGRSDGGC